MMDTTTAFYTVLTVQHSPGSVFSVILQNVSVNQSFLWISKTSPENDVCV